ncbi:MAG: RNA methyltransferase [Alicyclobacillus sp.]|nr:RNA methyltransferase [Alicyclobacillus sp.]
MFIESTHNPKVRQWASLKTRKGRREHSAFLAEGRRLVGEALASARSVRALLWDVAAGEEPVELKRLAEARGVPIYDLSPQAFAAVSDTVTPQGVAVVVEHPMPSAASFPAFTLVLDGLRDPGNVGTLLRTAEAFGVSEVCCGADAADPLAPKVVRASMGAVFRLSLPEQPSRLYLHAWRGHWPDGQVVVCDAAAEQTCAESDFTRPTAIVVGSEAWGLSEDVRAAADRFVRIPMDPPVESLNAAVAGSVMLYEAYRQRGGRSGAGGVE